MSSVRDSIVKISMLPKEAYEELQRNFSESKILQQYQIEIAWYMHESNRYVDVYFIQEDENYSFSLTANGKFIPVYDGEQTKYSARRLTQMFEEQYS